MTSYQDKYTRWHNKKTDGVKRSSGNGWIYSAYAKYLMPDTLDKAKIKKCFKKCLKKKRPLRVNRSPKDIKEPMSKDEIIGMVSLGLLSNKTLRKSHYNFCSLKVNFDRRLTATSIARATCLLHKIRNKDRKYAWQHKMVGTYPLLFVLPPWDIYYVKKMGGVKPTKLESLAFHANKKSVIKGKNGSTQMLLWLQLKDMGMSTRGIDLDFALKHDFKKGHPFYRD